MGPFSAILTLFLSCLSLACASLVQAAQVGSPASLLKKGQWDFSIEGGYLYERPLESSGNADYHVNIAGGFHARSFGLTDRLTVTGKVGGTSGYLYDESVAGAEGKSSLSGGMGLGAQLKGIIFKNKASGFEWDGSGQFYYLRAHRKRSGKANADWYEWQVASCAAWAINRFKPYLGLKFSTVDFDYDDGEGNAASYDEDQSLGPFVGADIYLGQDKDILINLEASFLTGTEFYGGIKYRF